jgi:hypothetical protein
MLRVRGRWMKDGQFLRLAGLGASYFSVFSTQLETKSLPTG